LAYFAKMTVFRKVEHLQSFNVSSRRVLGRKIRFHAGEPPGAGICMSAPDTFPRNYYRSCSTDRERLSIGAKFGDRFIADAKKTPYTFGRKYPELAGDPGRRHDEPESRNRFREFSQEFVCRAAEPANVLHAYKNDPAGLTMEKSHGEPDFGW